jgi:heme O synthase-like polyprenyltransferase
MSDSPGRRPSVRERARPAEVLGLSAVLAAFVGVGVLFATRNLLLAVEFFGAAFVVSVVVCATLLLAISKPEPPDGPSAH